MGRLFQRYGVAGALSGIFLLALGLRLWGIDHGLPYLFHPDEPLHLFLSLRMVKTGDLNPHFFLKPTFFMYLNALLYLPFLLVGQLQGLFAGAADIPYPRAIEGALAIGHTALPATFIAGRLITALFGAATTLVVYALGRAWRGGTAVGLSAAFLLAVAPNEVASSRLVMPDTFMVFFLSLTAYFALRIYRRGARRDYIMAGIACGLTVANKYNGGLIILTIPLAHLLRHGWRQLIHRDLLWSLNIAFFSFLLVTPYAVLDYQTFVGHVVYEFFHYAAIGHPGQERSIPVFYLRTMVELGGLILPAALWAAWRGWRRDRPVTLLLVAFPLINFIFISLFSVHNARMLLLIMPFLFVLAGGAVVSWARAAAERLGNRPVLPLTMLFTLLLAAWPLLLTVRQGLATTRPDSRTIAAAWIPANLPADARIMLESYAPWVDPAVHDVDGILQMNNRAPDWYVDNGFDYLVFSQGMYARFLDQPALYPDEVARYQALFDAFTLEKRFDDGEYEVLIYHVTPAR